MLCDFAIHTYLRNNFNLFVVDKLAVVVGTGDLLSELTSPEYWIKSDACKRLSVDLNFADAPVMINLDKKNAKIGCY